MTWFVPLTVEEQQVISQELGYVDVPQGAQHDLPLVAVRHLSDEVAGHRDHGLHGAHAEVVVILGTSSPSYRGLE